MDDQLVALHGFQMLFDHPYDGIVSRFGSAMPRMSLDALSIAVQLTRQPMLHAKTATEISMDYQRSAHLFDWRHSRGALLALVVAASGCGGGTSPVTPANNVGGSTSVQSSATGGATQASTTEVSTGGSSEAPSTGGATAAQTGGASAAAGGKAAGGSAAGGSVATGGAATTIGTTAAGGKGAGGATTGAKATGGAVGAGGSTAAGGKGAGGTTTGPKATGGAVAAGGTIAASGGSASGGSTGTLTPSAENTGASCKATSAALLSTQMKKLPDPFAMHDGTRISNKDDWECRRNEALQDIYKYEIGPKPDPSETTVKATLSGTSLSVVVTSSSGSLTIKATASGSGSCVVIGTDMAPSIISGCTNFTFSTNDVIPYNGGSGSQRQSDPFYKVFPSLWGKIGNYTAWSWGVSRLIDGLEQVKDQLKIDTTKIATHGCSYAGKMALFAGALDERVALTVAQESGGGGIDAWRASADFKSRTGTDVEKIDNTNYAWFMSSMKSLDPYKLPHDHHELIAAVAPRAIIILGNPGYEWLGDESGYKSTTAAVEVFKALGVADHIGYDFTGGHAHCSAPTSQQNSVNAFADKFLKGKTSANTTIAIKPTSGNFDLSADYDWTAPTLQ